MKLKILAVTFIILLSVTVGAAAFEGDNFSVELEGFKIANSTDDLTEIADVLQMKKADVKQFIKENGVLFIAADKENAVQVRLSRFKTDFSRLANDMSQLDDSGIESLADTISDENEKYTASFSNGRKYIRSVHNLADASGNYVSAQYFTVMDGYIYNLSVYSPEGKGTAVSEKIFSSLNLYSENSDSTVSVGWTLLFAAVVAVLTAIFVLALVGIIKSVRNKDKNGEKYTDVEKNA